jgi:hypothetical protein
MFPSGPLRRVLGAYALYGVVELATWVAVVLFAYDRGGPSLAAVSASVQLLPAAVLTAPLTGLADRLPRGTALACTRTLVPDRPGWACSSARWARGHWSSPCWS